MQCGPKTGKLTFFFKFLKSPCKFFPEKKLYVSNKENVLTGEKRKKREQKLLRSPVIMYHRKKDVNYQVLKEVSADELAQNLAEADCEAVRGPTMSPCFSSCVPLQPAHRLAFTESPVIHRCFRLLYPVEGLTAQKSPK